MDRLIKNISFAVVLVIILLSFGTIYFNKSEGFSYVDSFYFSVMTLTTIGYGDFVPTKDITKIITSLYAIFGIGIMFYLLSTIISERWLKQKKLMENIFNSLTKKVPSYIKAKVKKEKKSKENT